MADVFIDYDLSDRDMAHAVAQELLFRELSSFLVDRDLPPADRTALRIGEEAARARVVVVLWSAAAASALKGRGALDRAGDFIRYWSEERLVLAQLDPTPLPLGLRGLVSVPLGRIMWDRVADAAAKLVRESSSQMMDLGDHDWEGITQVWAAQPRPGAAPEEVRSAELGDHEWQGASQMTAPAPQPASPPAPAPESLFVSYAHDDLPRVDPIVGEISALGFPVWIDRKEMSSVAGWAGQITRAIKSSRAIVLMASTSAYASDHVVREMYLAMNAKKKIVPIELETAAMPDEFEYILAPFQRFAIDSGPREAVLTRALKTL